MNGLVCTGTAAPLAGVQPHNQHLQEPWARALGDYQERVDADRAAVSDDERVVAACDRAGAFNRLIGTRSPDLDALREKVRIIRNELGDVPQRTMTQLLADIDRLN